MRARPHTWGGGVSIMLLPRHGNNNAGIHIAEFLAAEADAMQSGQPVATHTRRSKQAIAERLTLRLASGPQYFMAAVS